MKISIVVPFYNEELLVHEFVDRVNAADPGTRFRVEIVAVDDGSSDRTYEAIKEHAARDLERNRGEWAGAGFHCAGKARRHAYTHFGGFLEWETDHRSQRSLPGHQRGPLLFTSRRPEYAGTFSTERRS